MPWADRPVWPWLKWQVEARLNFFYLQCVSGGGSGGESIKDIGAGECSLQPQSVQSFIKMNFTAVRRLGKREKRLRAERLLLCPKFEMVGPQLK